MQAVATFNITTHFSGGYAEHGVRMQVGGNWNWPERIEAQPRATKRVREWVNGVIYAVRRE